MNYAAWVVGIELVLVTICYLGIQTDEDAEEAAREGRFRDAWDEELREEDIDDELQDAA